MAKYLLLGIYIGLTVPAVITMLVKIVASGFEVKTDDTDEPEETSRKNR